VPTLFDTLNKEDGRAEAGQLIRALVVCIVLTPVDGGPEADQVSDLASKPALAAGQKSRKSRSSSALRGFL
jgi:hypothetical protein